MISFSRDNNTKIFRGKRGYVIFLKKFLSPNFKEFEEKLLTSYLKKINNAIYVMKKNLARGKL